MLHSAKKTKGGPFRIDYHTFFCKISKKNLKGGPFGDIKKNFEKKSNSAQKKTKGGTFQSRLVL